MAEIVRLSSIQTHYIPTIQSLRTNAFLDDFVLEDLFEQVERSVAWYEPLFERAAKNGAQLTVVTEDFSHTGYAKRYLEDRSIFRAVVQKQTPMIIDRVGAAAKKHNMYIVACYYAPEGDKIYNVSDLFGPKGDVVGRYRKVHLPQYELWQVAVGDSFPAFETDIGWISMLICYDQIWPEASAACAMNGAQIICQPSAAVLQDYRIRTRAADNKVHMVSTSAYRSKIVSPGGEILSDAGKEQHFTAWADVDIVESSKAHPYFWEVLFSGIQDHKERHLKYRQPDTYRVLTDPHPPLAEQYPEGGVANTPEAQQQTYETFKEMYRRELRGEKIPWGWDVQPNCKA